MSNWTGMDPDDVSGYLMDYLKSKFSDDGNLMSAEQLDDRISDDGATFMEPIIREIRDALEAEVG